MTRGWPLLLLLWAGPALAEDALLSTWASPAQTFYCAAFSPDGAFALAGSNGFLRLWDAASGTQVAAWPAHDGPVRAVAFSPDGRRALSGGADRALRLWDVASRRVLAVLEGHRGEVSSIAFFPDGKRALSASWDKTVKVWDLDSARALATWSGHSWNIDSVALSPDGRSALTGSLDMTVRLWDVASGKAVAVWPGHAGEVHAVAFSPDGRKALSAGADQTLYLWDAAAGKALARWDGHRNAVLAAAFSPDGRLAVSGSRDRSLRLWDVSSGKELAAWKSHIETVNAVVFSPDGRKVLSASEDGTLKLWRVSGGAGAAAIPRPKEPPRLEVSVALAEPSGNRALDGEERGALKVSVSNTGRGAAYSLTAGVSLPDAPGLSAPRALPLGDLEPGSKLERDVPLEASAALLDGTAEIRLEVREGNGFDAEPQVLRIRTVAFKPPQLEVTRVSVGGGGVIKPGEVAEITVAVRNAGAGPATEARAVLVTGDPNIFPSGEPKVELGALRPGQSKTLDFAFVVNTRFKGPALPVAVELTESLGRYGRKAPLGLALGGGPRTITVVDAGGPPDAAAGPSLEELDTPPPSKVPLDPEAYAVVIGIERYRQKGLPAVDFAARDATSMRDYLVGAMGFDEKNVVLLVDEAATKTDLEKYLGPWLANRVTAKSRVFIFYAGHGTPDAKTQNAFLIPYEGDPNYTEVTAFPVKQLYANLAALPTRDAVVVLDACFSGQGNRSVLAKGTRPLVTKVEQTGSVGENTTVITAAGGDQVSTYFPDGQHGLLTYFLLKGLRGEGDADRDGRVTTRELFGFLGPSVEREAKRQNVTQVPTITPRTADLGEKGERVWVKTR